MLLLRAEVFCDNNGGGHFECLSTWEVVDIISFTAVESTARDMADALGDEASEEGWLLIPAEHKGWTRVLCNKCCAGQGGQDG